MASSPFRLSLLILSLVLLTACSSGGGNNTVDGDQEQEGEDPVVTLTYVTTTDTILSPTLPVEALNQEQCEGFDAPAWCENPGRYEPGVDSIAAAKAAGYGQVEEKPGEAVAARDDLGTGATAGGTFSLVLRFAHTSDVHITDEESPTRTALLDGTGIPEALRPQDPYSCQVFDAALRTINGINKKRPIDFLLVTGDVTDSAQKNELSWFFNILTGGQVNCDSGADDDPVAGPGNDAQDPFAAAGLDIPWYYTPGNHDELVMGNSRITQDAKTKVVGDYAELGTRNGATYEIINDIVADPERVYLDHDEVVAMALAAGGLPAGHGLTQANVEGDRAYYQFDAPGDAPVRFIVLDTTYRAMGWADQFTYVQGVIDKHQFEDFLAPALSQAMTDKKLVFVLGHHNLLGIQDDGSPDAYYNGDDLVDLFSQYPCVVAYLEGHQHENLIQAFPSPEPTQPQYGFWTIQSPSLVDWPQQFRIYELRNYGGGVFSFVTESVNHIEETDSLAWEGRTLSLLDIQTGWMHGGNEGTATDRNQELFFTAPEGWFE